MNALPPLFRAAMVISLQNAGVEGARVSKHGRVTECPVLSPASDRVPLTDPVFVVQAVVEADLIVEALTGQPSLVGKSVLKLLKIDGAETVYDSRRDLSHDFSHDDFADACWLAASMISKSKAQRNLTSRRRDDSGQSSSCQGRRAHDPSARRPA